MKQYNWDESNHALDVLRDVFEHIYMGNVELKQTDPEMKTRTEALLLVSAIQSDIEREMKEQRTPKYHSLFEKDNFNSRRTTGHNLFDIDSMITGDELSRGMTYANSFRNCPSQEIYELACRGYLALDRILNECPRIKDKA